MIDFINNPVFICGHPKAGTSLMSSLLDGHPEIVAYPEETMFFRRFLPAIENVTFQEKLELAEKLLIHIFEWNIENPPAHQNGYPDRDYSDISFDAVRSGMICKIPAHSENPAEILNAVILSFGKVTGQITGALKHWLEKTPYNEFHTDKIFRWWRNAKCIHMIRDPRGNYFSYQQKHMDWSAKIFSKNWVRSTNAGLENEKTYGSDQYLLIRFDDLLTSSEETMRKVAAFLDIQMDDILLNPTRVGASWLGNSMFNKEFQTISTTPLFRWKDKLDVFDQAILQTICGRLMVEFDFPLSDIEYRQFSVKQRFDILKERLFSFMK